MSRRVRSSPPDVTALRMLRTARDRIDRDYAESAGIADLAAEAGYSTTHFIHAFRATYGETPGAYRTRRRIERACELLRSVNLSVTEICHLVGFTSLGSFSTRFAELVGVSPTAYRQEAARRGGPAPIPGCFALMWRTGIPAASPAPGPRSPAALTSAQRRSPAASADAEPRSPAASASTGPRSLPAQP